MIDLPQVRDPTHALRGTSTKLAEVTTLQITITKPTRPRETGDHGPSKRLKEDPGSNVAWTTWVRHVM